MVTLVIGASGLVGYEFYRQMRRDRGWRFTYRNWPVGGFMRLDATDRDGLHSALGSVRPDTIILPAGMSDVNRCESEPGPAARQNIGILKNTIDGVRENGLACRIAFFSSDYVFNGDSGPYCEGDSPDPVNQYGEMKLECERLLEGSGLRHIIIRTCGVFGWEPQRKNFCYRVLDSLGAGKELVVPEDQYYTPTYVADLVSAVLHLLGRGSGGLFHVAGPECLGRVSFARKIASSFGLPPHLIKGKPSREFPGLARRPLRAGLKMCRPEAKGIAMRPVHDALADMKARKSAEF